MQEPYLIEYLALALFPIGCLVLHLRVRHIASLVLCCSVTILLIWQVWGAETLSMFLYDAMISQDKMEWRTHNLIVYPVGTVLALVAGVSFVWTASRVRPHPADRA